MHPISTCPKCRLQISLPQRLSGAALVKCPLCAAEYTLQEAIDQAPPLLIVLDPGPALESAFDSQPDPMSACATGLLPEVQFGDQEGDGSRTGSPGEAHDAAGIAHFADDEDVESRVTLGDEPAAEGGAMVGGLLREEADSGRLHLDDEEVASARSRFESRREKSGIAEAIKAIFGAVIGLTIGYYILLWCGRDPLQFRPQLDKYLPAFVLPGK